MDFINVFFCFYFFFSWYFFFSMKLKFLRSQGTSFECGFENFSSSRVPFSLHFYLIGMLFLVFDIEIIYLLFFISSIKVTKVSMWGFSVSVILLIFCLGLEYEKYDGSLNWIF